MCSQCIMICSFVIMHYRYSFHRKCYHFFPSEVSFCFIPLSFIHLTWILLFFKQKKLWMSMMKKSLTADNKNMSRSVFWRHYAPNNHLNYERTWPFTARHLQLDLTTQKECRLYDVISFKSRGQMCTVVWRDKTYLGT